MSILTKLAGKPTSIDKRYDTDRRRNYERLRLALEKGDKIIGRYPINVQIQTISVCNGKCEFCPYVGSWSYRNPGKMTDEVYEKIINELSQYKIRKFCPYLENEPLLDGKLFERIEYAYGVLKPAWVEISTNLSVLNDDILDNIVRLFSRIPHEIWVSFHGVSKDTYEDIMGLSFEKTFSNVIRLVEVAQKIPLNIIIRGAGRPRLLGEELKSWFGEEEYKEFWNGVFSKFKRKPEISFFTYHDRADAEQLKKKGMSFNRIFREDLEGFYCWRFDRWVHFLYTGEPILCCMDYERETGFGKTIVDATVPELYSLPVYKEMLMKGIGMIDSEQDFICKRCVSPRG